MANYSTLKAAVADVVKTNGEQAITGANLQSVLLSIINSVGGGGYIFKGVATPSTDAGTPDENVFYIGGAGTYANFGTSVTVPVGSIGVFKYNGSWAKEQIALFAGIDDVPTAGSDNLVKSGGVATELTVIKGSYTQSRTVEVGNANITTDIPVKVKSGQTITIESISDATVNTFRIYGNEAYGINLGFTSINEKKTYTASTDIEKIVVLYSKCTVGGTLTIKINYADSLESVVAELKKRKISAVPLSKDLVTSGAVYDSVTKIFEEIYGQYKEAYYQGNIASDIGKFLSGSKRVTNELPIDTKDNIHVVCTGDVRANSVVFFKDGKSPVDGGVLNTDFINVTLPSSSSRTDFVIERNNTYPNVYITFCNASDSTANISADYVSTNVQIHTGTGFGSFNGIAYPETVPDTSKVNVSYLAIYDGTYTNFGNIVVNTGETCLLCYENSTWRKTVIATEERDVLGKNDALDTICGFIDYTTGELTTRSSGFFLKKYNANGISLIKLYAGAGSTTTAQIAFYSRDEISSTSYLGAYSIQSILDEDGSGRWYYTSNIPPQAVIAVVYDRLQNVAEGDAIVQIEYRKLSSMVENLDRLDSDVYGVRLQNLELVQGGYSSTGELTDAGTRVRASRMIAKSEAPFDVYIPDTANGRLFFMNTYSVLDDFTSKTSQISFVNTNPQGLRITQEMIGENAGITLCFCAKNNTTSSVTPSDFSGTKFIVEPGLDDDINSMYPATKIKGNSKYYGRIITLGITEEKHKSTSRLVCEHYNDEYPYTTKNQSMAIWNGKAFCFNDTAFANTDGLCVIIDVNTGNVLGRVTDVPSVIASPMQAHLNAACFTDQYYSPSDVYPLLLLSRGDYPSSSLEKLCMYVFRITEPTENNFVFTLIKTINVHGVPLAIVNPSWCYDSSRKMIWGNLMVQDFRWQNSNYLKFNGNVLYFVPPTDTNYLCVESYDTAAQNATITIILGGSPSVTRDVEISTGEYLSEVFECNPYASGCCSIGVSQSDNAFTGRYNVYVCDANGNNKVQMVNGRAIQGFKCPDLRDPTTITIGLSDMTNPAYFDFGYVQDVCCANGKLFLPFGGFTTINGSNSGYRGYCCLVVDPISGYIESLIETVLDMESEGCAIWNGKLYISSHNGGATGHTIGFNLTEYSFD